MNYADIKKVDIANGEGVRVSLFVSGCTNRCPNCFNREAWDFSYGKPFTDDTMEYLLSCLEPDYIKGLSVLGGEPFDNLDMVTTIVKTVKDKYSKKSIWVYTGYVYEKLKPLNYPIFDYIDILVDGKYIEQFHKEGLKFRGSTNQRIIDVKKSNENQIVLYHSEYDDV